MSENPNIAVLALRLIKEEVESARVSIKIADDDGEIIQATVEVTLIDVTVGGQTVEVCEPRGDYE